MKNLSFNYPQQFIIHSDSKVTQKYGVHACFTQQQYSSMFRSNITLQLKLIRQIGSIIFYFYSYCQLTMNLLVEIRLINCFGMSFRGRMTQEWFLVSPRFLSMSVDVYPFIKKCWFAVVLQSLLLFDTIDAVIIGDLHYLCYQ